MTRYARALRDVALARRASVRPVERPPPYSIICSFCWNAPGHRRGKRIYLPLYGTAGKRGKAQVDPMADEIRSYPLTVTCIEL